MSAMRHQACSWHLVSIVVSLAISRKIAVPVRELLLSQVSLIEEEDVGEDSPEEVALEVEWTLLGR